MIDKIQIVLGVFGILSCAAGAVFTGEIGYAVATIWAAVALVSHLNNY